MSHVLYGLLSLPAVGVGLHANRRMIARRWNGGSPRADDRRVPLTIVALAAVAGFVAGRRRARP